MGIMGRQTEIEMQNTACAGRFVLVAGFVLDVTAR